MQGLLPVLCGLQDRSGHLPPEALEVALQADCMAGADARRVEHRGNKHEAFFTAP